MPERARAPSALPDRRTPRWHHVVAAAVALAVALTVAATPAPDPVTPAEQPGRVSSALR